MGDVEIDEVWKKVVGHETYEVSNRGRVRNSRGLIMKTQQKEDKYVRIKLSLGSKGKSKEKLMHHLVGDAFLERPEDAEQVHHIDHDPGNNDVENLKWVTKAENRAERRGDGVINQGKGARRSVWKCDMKTGEQIERYDSGVEALKDIVNGSNSGLCGALTGHRKSYKGFKWKYVKSPAIEGEIWRILHPHLIGGAVGYRISSEGRVVNKLGDVRDGYIHSSGYRRFSICGTDYCVHVLVAHVFLPNILGKLRVNHKDGNKKNPRLWNLTWSTDSENTLHAHMNGLINISKAVKQLSHDGQNILNAFDSLSQAGRVTDLSAASISYAAKNDSLCGCFRWKFVDASDEQVSSKKGRKQAIRQYDMKGDRIQDFEAVDHAAKDVGMHRCIFRKRIQKSSIVAGFRWRILS